MFATQVEPPGPAESIEEVTAELASVVDRLLALDATVLSDDELSEAVMALQTQSARLVAASARVLSAFDARRVWVVDRARSAAAWLTARCRIPGSEARRRVRLARRLRSMPHTEEALTRGEIDVSHAERLARALTPERKEAFAAHEADLVGHARELRFSHFQRVVAYWEQVADPDGAEDDARTTEDSRLLHLSQTLGGTWVLDAIADPIRGAIVHRVVSSIEDELFEADWKQAKAIHGDETRAEHLARTPAQRRLDALVEMARRAASVPPEARAPRPLFTVLVGYETLAGRICELADGTALTPGQLVPYLAEADIERVVFDGPSRVIDVGVRRRLFEGATRRAVEVRDRCCTHETCEEPAERCDIDHVVPYAAGGLTVQGNGRPRCPAHNPGRRRPPSRPPP